jgi:iron complex outermembrane recepter protein
MKPFLMRALACELVLLMLPLLFAQAQNAPPDLTALKIEDLMNVDVTSAGKKEQKLSQVSGALFVITAEDIRRSGATNIPDLLRMVPGLEVAQIDPSTWAISARGFNGEYSNKLLVLIDGRTAYSPVFSGVYWDAQDVPLDLIERIEVIRGPGATVWGTNAVNGVISIITRSAQDTKRGAITVDGGTFEHIGGMIRCGGPLGPRGAYRVFLNGFDMGQFVTPENQNGENDWYLFHGGFRADAQVSTKNSLTLEGEAIRGNEGELTNSIISLEPPLNGIVNLREDFSGWSLLGRWKRALSPASETSLQIYFDRSNRGDPTYGIALNTFDFDFQHHAQWGRRQDFVWGLGYRLTSDDTADHFRISFQPQDLVTQIYSSFVQDDIAVRPNRLHLSLGTKLEHEYYNGFNLQPSGRLTWTPDERDTFWAAFSGAQRTPSRVETSIRYNLAALPGPDNLPALVSVFGNPGQLNERLLATEAGFRKHLSDRLSVDSSAFFNQYHDLASNELGAPRIEVDPPPIHLLVPEYFANLIHGETHGIEIFANMKLNSRWTLSPGYTFLTMHLRPEAGSTDRTTGPETQGSSPTQQAQLRSNVNLPWHWQWTTSAYFVGRLPAQSIPSYTRLDSNLAWQVSEKISAALVGQDLLRNLHQEYAGPDLTVLPSLIPRSAYGRITWRF